MARSSNLAVVPLPCALSHRHLGGEELKIVVLIEPGAFEVFERQVESAAQRDRVDRQLHMRVRFLFGPWLVIQDVQIPVADLKEVQYGRL